MARTDDDQGRAPWDAWDWVSAAFMVLVAWGIGNALGYTDGLIDGAEIAARQQRHRAQLDELQRYVLTPPLDALPQSRAASAP